MTIGAIGYTIAAVFYGVFVLLLLRRRHEPQSRSLAWVGGVTAVWAISSVWVATTGNLAELSYQVAEILRYVVWGVFLQTLAGVAGGGDHHQTFLRRVYAGAGIYTALVLGGSILLPLGGDWVTPEDYFLLYMTSHLLFPIAGLAVVEHLVRAADARCRWEMKFLFLAVVGVLTYDVFLYSGALLFGNLNSELWQARGWVNAAAVPVLAIAIARNRGWTSAMFLSRDVVFHSATLMVSGVYLIVAAGAGYYVNTWGGTWGGVAQVVFLSLAVLVLATLLFSSQLRAQLRVFLSKHFFQTKYEYRQEWLRLTQALSNPTEPSNQLTAPLRVLATIVDARRGMLWLVDGVRGFRNAASWQMAVVDEVEPADSSLTRFLQSTGYVITVPEVLSQPQEYDSLTLPAWLDRAWLIVPLFNQSKLLGFVVLSDPLVNKAITWEDRDLLKAAAQHVASHLAGLMASEALAEARQFEAFNRLSAFMVHDLKNVAAELELIDRNAELHRANPAFVDDAFETVRNAAKDIRRMVDQFKNKRAASGKVRVVDVCELAKRVVTRMNGGQPVPVLIGSEQPCYVMTDPERFTNVLRHLLDNAQQATPSDGFVRVRLEVRQAMCAVVIEDSGCGMDPEFVRHRLFKPFDTTKGNAGMGIGMFESREYIRSLGGDFHVASVPGKGTSVTLMIPLRQHEHDRSDIAATISY